MLKRVLLTAVLLATLLAAGLPQRALAQGGPVLIGEASLPQSERQKYPHIDTLGSTVYVAGNAEREFSRLWTKTDTALAFGSPRTLGGAPGVPDYATSSIFVTNDGTIHVAWINAGERRIYIRTKGPSDADFRPQLSVYGIFTPFEVEVAANEDGVFVFWREVLNGVGSPVKFRRSPDGSNWAVPVETLGSVSAEPLIDVAAGPGRKLAVAYYRNRVENDNDYLQGYLAVWNGTSFTNERIPAVPDRDFANPSVALLPDGSFTIAMRSTEKDSGAGAGVYVADRSAAGAWSSVIRLARGDTTSVSLDADSLGNVHLYIISKAAGPVGMYYTFRRPGQGYGGGTAGSIPSTLLTVQLGGQFLANVRTAASLRDRGYGHAAVERFSGDDIPFGHYFLVALPVNNVTASSIAIEAGAAITSKTTVNVTFSGVTGTPNAVRYAWGAPPAAGVAYTVFDPANPTIAVPLPGDADVNCSTLTLYTQLRSTAAEQVGTNSDTIVLDRAVQAVFTAAGPAPALDPAYTNALKATVSVFGGADCSGVAAATVSGPVTDGSVSLPVAGQPIYAQTIDLTGGPGAKELTFQATDGAGNAVGTPVVRTVIYDPVAPLFNGMAAETETTLTANPKATTQLALSIDNFGATDPGGVVAGIEIVVQGPAVGGSPSTSAPVRLAFADMDQVVTNQDGTLNLRATFSLTRFLPSSVLVPGAYSFVIRAVDGAGNASAASETRTETLTAITYPLWLPIARR